MRGRYHFTWVAALTTSVALAAGGDPATIATLDDAPAKINVTTKSATSGLGVSPNETAQGAGFNRVLDPQVPLCETATYISSLDVLVYLALKPALGLQDPLFHQTAGRVYNQVVIKIYGTTETAPLERRTALDGLYKGLEFLSATHSFYAMTQETVDSGGRSLAFIQFMSSVWMPTTTQGDNLGLTKRENTTEMDNGSCESSPAISDPKSASNTSIADTWQPASNNSDIDTLLEPSSTSVALPANNTQGSSNDDWFTWQDPYVPYLKMRCRFLPGPSLSWNVAYLPFAHYIWHGDLSYERGLDNPAMSIDLYNPGARLHFRLGGAPTGKAINPGFTNQIALMSLGSIPRILFEKKTWRGIQVQIILDEVTVGVVVMISDRALMITGAQDPGASAPSMLQNTPASGVDVA